MRASTQSIRIKNYHPSLIINVSAQWRFSRLARIQQRMPAELTYTLYANGKKVGKRTDMVQVDSVAACPYAYVNAKGHIHSLAPFFVAYVNGNNPALDGILKQAIKDGYVKQFDGYQANAAGVVQQVAAIWLVLQQRGIHYSNIAAPTVEPGKILYQRVRSVDQSLHSAQANCVDGTVLFASALEHIGIDCDLVHPPGHMFLRFYAAKSHQMPLYLETTLLDAHAAVNSHLVNPVGKAFPWYDLRDRPVEAAIQCGCYEAAALAKVVAGAKSMTAKEQLCSIISIAKARKFGISPIPALPTSADHR